MRYKLSHEAKLDFARIYWRGIEKFGECQADRYYKALTRRFDAIDEAPYKYPALTISVRVTGVVSAVSTASTTA